MLAKAGFVHSQRGNNGGYRLARKPEDYTAGDILRVMEGNLQPIACLEADPNECARSAYCSVLPFWQGLGKVVNDYVDSVTLEELADQARFMAGNDYSI